jgi:hypothetical protein
MAGRRRRIYKRMYKIEKSDLGFHLTFGGTVTKAELERWYDESELALKERKSPFGVIIDMRTLTPLPVEAQEIMVRGQAMYRAQGMQRSCVILGDAITTIQFMRLANRSGIRKQERYIDASTDKEWLENARNWVEHAAVLA